MVRAMVGEQKKFSRVVMRVFLVDESNVAKTQKRKPSPADFMFGTTLGEGAYARVSGPSMIQREIVSCWIPGGSCQDESDWR